MSDTTPSGHRDVLRDTVSGHWRDGSGLTSVCSAHPLVLEAAVIEGATADSPILIEATSNQVNQDGGYTGLRPDAFRAQVLAIAADNGVSADRIILGGDHLGPNPWRQEAAAVAMTRGEELVGAYASAGFTKIHLDCSMPCADEVGPLTDAVVSQRAARLLAAAENAAPDRARVSYVIGTEVPVPGGASEAIAGLRPTTPQAARRTLTAHREAFASAGHGDAWSRVRGLVVQPAVEFDEWTVVDYDSHHTEGLQRVLADDGHDMVYEAHSTDYQTPGALADLVRDHWALLKVGPGLTFALREALFALETIERVLCPSETRSRLTAVLEARMLADPRWWRDYYDDDLARRFSYSDRARYYWPDREVQDAQARLLANLVAVEIPMPLISQTLPRQYDRIRTGGLAIEPRALVIDHVVDVLRGYRAATTPRHGVGISPG